MNAWSENPWMTVLILVGLSLMLLFVLSTVFTNRRVNKAHRMKDIDAYIAEIKKKDE